VASCKEQQYLERLWNTAHFPAGGRSHHFSMLHWALLKITLKAPNNVIYTSLSRLFHSQFYHTVRISHVCMGARIFNVALLVFHSTPLLLSTCFQLDNFTLA